MASFLNVVQKASPWRQAKAYYLKRAAKAMFLKFYKVRMEDKTGWIGNSGHDLSYGDDFEETYRFWRNMYEVKRSWFATAPIIIITLASIITFIICVSR